MSSSFSAVKANYPSRIGQSVEQTKREWQPGIDVGEVLRRMDALRALSEAELVRHIEDCGQLMLQAYARFQETGSGVDRAEAVVWLHRKNEALMTRSGMDAFLGREGER